MPRNGLVLLVGVVGACACALVAQVVPTQDGRALDSNNQVGSAGYNSIRQTNRAIDGNLYMTGQVGGGFYSFHGTNAYSGANQLGMSLPSSDMNDFLRQSASVNYARNPVYGPRAYNALSQTVLSAADINRGLAAPGTSIPRTAYTPPPANADTLYQQAISAYAPLILKSTQGGTPVEPGLVARLNALAEPTLGPVDFGAARPEASELFGLVAKQDKQKLLDELGRSQWIGPDAGRSGSDKPSGTFSTEKPAGPKADPTKIEPGNDVFMDMIMASGRYNERTAPPDKPDRRSPTASQPAGAPGRATPVEKVKDGVLIHSLVGRNADSFNAYLAKAERALVGGRYYDAAGAYRMALLINPDNPLAWTGASLALFAANEPLTSAFNLREAMRRFPPLMEMRLDLSKLIGDKVVRQRIEQLDARLAKAEKPEPGLYFVTAFIHAQLGQTDQARQYAQKLRDSGSAEPIQQAYARYLLEGLVTTQPAR